MQKCGLHFGQMPLVEASNIARSTRRHGAANDADRGRPLICKSGSGIHHDRA
jgi:hypothetical protein